MSNEAFVFFSVADKMGKVIRKTQFAAEKQHRARRDADLESSGSRSREQREQISRAAGADLESSGSRSRTIFVCKKRAGEAVWSQ